MMGTGDEVLRHVLAYRREYPRVLRKKSSTISRGISSLNGTGWSLASRLARRPLSGEGEDCIVKCLNSYLKGDLDRF